jgi:putative transposase
MTKYKEYNHNPPHLFLPNCHYFITASTLGRYPYLKSVKAKEAAYFYLTKSLEKFSWILEDWVILDNHLHIMVKSPQDSTSLGKVMNNFYRFTANWLSKNSIRKIKQKYFHNYWDKCISYESSYYSRINYIWFNPVKHGYVDSPEKWQFGSYHFRFHKDKIDRRIKKYPFDKLDIADDF